MGSEGSTAVMRAIAVQKFGGAPEKVELPKPTPGPGEVLVHLAAAGVNPFDWKIADGMFRDARPHVFPLVLGVDGAGTVEAVGEGVSRFAVDDGVFGHFFHDPVGTGTYAEYVVAPESIAIAVRPRGMYSDQGAAVPLPAMTALNALDELGLGPRQVLLIVGAAGGIGSFAVQLASNLGITTLTAARGAPSAYLHKLGASRVYDAALSSFPDDLRAAYPEGVDGLLDLASDAAALEAKLGLVRSGGTVVSTRGAVMPQTLAARHLRGVNIDLQPKTAYLDRIATEFVSGRLRVPLEQKRPLDDAPAVLEESRQGTLRGKTVLTI